MYPARRWTGATCRGRPRHRLPAPPKCHHRGSRRRPRTTRMWDRARDKQLTLPERTSGRSALAWRPAGRAPPSRREPRPAKLTPKAVGGAIGSHPPTFQRFRPPRLGLFAEASVAGEVDGLGVDAECAAGGGFWCRLVVPVVVTYLGRRSPGRSRFPLHRRGPRTNPDCRRGRRISPRAVGGAHCHR
jgi:hypothetical protein